MGRGHSKALHGCMPETQSELRLIDKEIDCCALREKKAMLLLWRQYHRVVVNQSSSSTTFKLIGSPRGRSTRKWCDNGTGRQPQTETLIVAHLLIWRDSPFLA